ncbi:MAG: metal-dependent transcriptional regulator [Candidatus Diapherotrites archaeon]
MVGHKRHERLHSTESVEEYLEALCRLVEKGEKLNTTNLAEKLDVSPASVSEMLRTLAKKGYVKYAPYKDIELTLNGKRIGNKILGRHRLLERFLEGMGLHGLRIHDEACRLEHYISDELEAILKKKMDSPRKKGIISLAEMRDGEEGAIVSMGIGACAVKRLEDMGLTPGIKVKIMRSAPFFGPVEICVRDSCLVIGQGMAAKVFVKVGK